MRGCTTSISFLAAVLLSFTTEGLKLKFASEKDCDRLSLDALYHEKYSPMTSESLSDITEFIRRVTDLISGSLLSVMADLPDSASSSVEERKIFEIFKEMRRRFEQGISKIKKNTTLAWESLLAANQDLMLDAANSSIDDVCKKFMNVSEVYIDSRSVLDHNVEKVITAIKNIVRNGMKGIAIAAEKEMEKEDQNATKKSLEEETVSKEEVLKGKKKRMVETLVPQFLGRVSMITIENDVDLEKTIRVKREDRDSVLDDIYFSLLIMRNRVNVITQKSYPQNKENIDLARRNLYVFWADQANTMYEDKIKEQRTAPSDGRNRKQWEDEDELAEELVSLMEQYP